MLRERNCLEMTAEWSETSENMSVRGCEWRRTG